LVLDFDSGYIQSLEPRPNATQWCTSITHVFTVAER